MFCYKVDLSRNEISSVRSGDFTAWQMLSLLYLNYNKIHHVAIDAFLPNHVRNLMVTNNQLVCVPDVQGQNEILSYLFLSHNKLGSCTEEVIYKVPMFRLHSLRLDSNGLHNLPSIVYSSPNLKWLNLKNNLLTAITPFNTGNQQSFDLCRNPMICCHVIQWIKALEQEKNFRTDVQCDTDGPNGGKYLHDLTITDVRQQCPAVELSTGLNSLSNSTYTE